MSKKPDWLAHFILRNYFSRHLNNLLNYISIEQAAVHSPNLTTQNNDEQLKALHKLLNIVCISLEKLKESYEKKASQLAALYTERRPATQ